MEFGNIMLDSEGIIFGSVDGNRVCSDVIESVLRYIEIKDCDDLEKINLVKQAKFANLDSISEQLKELNFVSITDREKILEKFPSPDWEYLDSEAKASRPVATYLSAIQKTIICINKKEQKAVVGVAVSGDSFWGAAFASCIFAVLPWRFGQVLTDTEKTLFTAYKNHEQTKIGKILDEIYSHTNAEDVKTKIAIYDYDSIDFDKEFERMKYERKCLEEEVQELEQRLSGKYSKLCGKIAAIEKLCSSSTENRHDFYNFFLQHKNLSVVRKDQMSNELAFRIEDYIEYFDKDEFKKVSSNPRSVFNLAGSTNARELFFLLFDLELGKIHVESEFKFCGLSSLSPVKHFSRVNKKETIPHPHLYHFACLGGNAGYITQYLSSGDWDMAIEQAIAATKNFNFGDSTVLDRFLRDVENYYTDSSLKCILDNDGNKLTLKEFHEKYKDKLHAEEK